MKTTDVRIPAIEEFLAKWKERARKYYNGMVEKGNQIEADHLEWCKQNNKENGRRETAHTSEHMDHYRNTVSKFYREAGAVVQDLRYRSKKEQVERLETILAREVERKRLTLVEKTQEIVGTITDAFLCIGDNGDLNGTVYGTDGKATVTTITAGGHNIQCLHYRVLVRRIG